MDQFRCAVCVRVTDVVRLEPGYVFASELALRHGKGDAYAAENGGVLDTKTAAGRIACGEQSPDGTEVLGLL